MCLKNEMHLKLPEKAPIEEKCEELEPFRQVIAITQPDFESKSELTGRISYKDYKDLDSASQVMFT